MTVDNQNVEMEFSNVYRGKKWSMGKILGIYAVICATMFIRDLGMVFIYSSIYDTIAVDGIDAGVSFLNYALTVVLFLLPIVFPFILKLKGTAYYDEPQGSLLPSVGKVGSIIMYVIVVIVMLVPVILTMLGIFTSSYMFVAINIMLHFLSGVVLFYYFGTYFFQRAKVSLSTKYTVPTLLMVVATVVSLGLTIGVVFVLKLAGVAPSILTHFDTYIATLTTKDIVIPSVYMFLAVSLGAIFSGWLYHLTQNIIYSVVPTFVVAFPNVVLFQRISEATESITKNLAIVEAGKGSEAKLAEAKALLSSDRVGLVICYVLLAFTFVILLAIGLRAFIGMLNNRKDAK